MLLQGPVHGNSDSNRPSIICYCDVISMCPKSHMYVWDIRHGLIIFMLLYIKKNMWSLREKLYLVLNTCSVYNGMTRERAGWIIGFCSKLVYAPSWARPKWWPLIIVSIDLKREESRCREGESRVRAHLVLDVNMLFFFQLFSLRQ